MKDKHDTKTRNLLQNNNAKNQAKFREKMKEKGFKQTQVWLNKESYELGKSDAKSGSTNAFDGSQKAKDAKSYFLGYGEIVEKQREAIRKNIEEIANKKLSN